MRASCMSLGVACLVFGGIGAPTWMLNSLRAAQEKEPVPAAAGLRLSEGQRQAIQAIRSQAKKKAAPLVLQLAPLAKEANENMLADNPDADRGRVLGQRIRRLLGELLDIRIQSIKEALKLLAPEQRKQLKAALAKPGAPADLMELMERCFKLPSD